MGDKCKIMRPKAPRVKDKCGKQVEDKGSVNSCGPRHPSVRDKWETSVKSCGPRHPEWETSAEDKWKTSVNSCGPRHPQWETSVRDKWETSVNSCGPRRPEWETSVGDKCKLMRPKARKCEGQVRPV